MNPRFLRMLPSRVRQQLERVSRRERWRVLTRGTLVTCPSCAAEIGEVTDDIGYGSNLATGKFRMIQEGHTPGSAMHCRVCDTPFFDTGTGRIHTLEGWA